LGGLHFMRFFSSQASVVLSRLNGGSHSQIGSGSSDVF
jgi:hypothetical protein